VAGVEPVKGISDHGGVETPQTFEVFLGWNCGISGGHSRTPLVEWAAGVIG
jgi:hypothetical protein